MAMINPGLSYTLGKLIGLAAQNPQAVQRAAGWMGAGGRWLANRYNQRSTAMARYSNRGIPRSFGAWAKPGQMKWFDTSTGVTSMSTAISRDNLIAAQTQGTGASNRIANRIVIRVIQYRIIVDLPSQVTGTVGGSQYRIMFVQDKQANGALFNGTDLLVTDTSISPVNLTNSSRFKILKTHEGSLNYNTSYINAAGGASTLVSCRREYKGYLKVNIPIEFSANTGTIADLRTNNLYLCYSADVTGENPQISYYVRLRYDDPSR